MKMNLWLPPILTLALAAALLSGCGNSGELRSSEQAETFLVDVAHGGKITDWRLAGGASKDADRVWAERNTIQDLSRRLRREGKAWACQVAEDSAQLGSIGSFNANDRRSVLHNAQGLGANGREIEALLGDVLKLSNRDLLKTTAAVCDTGKVSANDEVAARLSSSATLPQIEVKSDADSDSDKYDSEPDNENEVFGRPASARDTHMVATLVRSYYAAAAAADSTAGCRLIYTPFAESVAEDLGAPTGPSGLRGNTCAAVLSKLFEQPHENWHTDDATLRVTSVRVDQNRGVALLGFRGTRPNRYVMAHRERGGWKLDMLQDVGRPIGVE
jgi:hypothetical protein